MVRSMMIAFAIGAIPSTLWLTMEQWQPKETMYFGAPDDLVCVGLADFDNALTANRELEQSGIDCHIDGHMLFGIFVAEEDVAAATPILAQLEGELDVDILYGDGQRDLTRTQHDGSR